MLCHYEVLEVGMSATDDEIRKSYRRLALRWHPDKNLTDVTAAQERFLLVQQAYEVLSDPQERAFYDKHRDTILRGGHGSDYKDDSLNVYEYFTTSCFSGFEDDPKGFYSIYSEVFNKIAAEDSEFDKNLDSDYEIPVFGDSKSNYDEVVHIFYAHWQSYSTKKTYSWLDEYDIRQAPNRKILKLIEKENKKIRDRARKERNEEVRALVAFVRKRDKRVIEHIKKLENEAAEKHEKAQEVRRQQILKRQIELKSYVESDWSKFSNLESELQQIEASMAAEFDDHSSSDSSSIEDMDFYSNFCCVACNKIFKTPKAFTNHENSKKHRDNVEALRIELLEDEVTEESEEGDEDWKLELRKGKTNENGDTVDSVLTEGGSLHSSGGSVLEDSEVEVQRPKKKKKQKKRFMKPPESDLSDDSLPKNRHLTSDQNMGAIKDKLQKKLSDDIIESEITENEISDSIQEDLKAGKFRSEKKKKSKQKKTMNALESSDTEFIDLKSINKRRNKNVPDDGDELNKKSKRRNKKKEVKNKVKTENTDDKSYMQGASEPDFKGACEQLTDHICEVCNFQFKTKNSLFKHLRETGHAVAKVSDSVNTKPKKSKK